MVVTARQVDRSHVAIALGGVLERFSFGAEALVGDLHLVAGGSCHVVPRQHDVLLVGTRVVRRQVDRAGSGRLGGRGEGDREHGPRHGPEDKQGHKRSLHRETS